MMGEVQSVGGEGDCPKCLWGSKDTKGALTRLVVCSSELYFVLSYLTDTSNLIKLLYSSSSSLIVMHMTETYPTSQSAKYTMDSSSKSLSHALPHYRYKKRRRPFSGWCTSAKALEAMQVHDLYGIGRWGKYRQLIW